MSSCKSKARGEEQSSGLADDDRARGEGQPDTNDPNPSLHSMGEGHHDPEICSDLFKDCDRDLCVLYVHFQCIYALTYLDMKSRCYEILQLRLQHDHHPHQLHKEVLNSNPLQLSQPCPSPHLFHLHSGVPRLHPPPLNQC